MRSTSLVTKILCLQSILEGNGVFLKRSREKFVRPTAGFNVIATANTKGKGSDDGRFIGTNVLNEAFLERFPVTFEQSYPTVSVEKNILSKICSDDDFCQRLVDWADIIRKTFYDGGIEEIISTRRLVHIVKPHMRSLAIRRRQCRSASIDLMKTPSRHSWNSMTKLM